MLKLESSNKYLQTKNTKNSTNVCLNPSLLENPNACNLHASEIRR